MMPCSCGSSSITVTPNRTASGWGPYSYTYTCDRCGATMTGTTIDEVRKKWDKRMSSKQIEWSVLVMEDGGKMTRSSLSSIEDVHLFIDTCYEAAVSIEIKKEIKEASD